MKIVLATNNPHKVGELTDLLSGEGREIRTLRESGFTGDIVEDGAIIVCRYGSHLFNLVVVVTYCFCLRFD